MRKNLSERILYEDNHLLILNKACGEISQPDKTGDPSVTEDLKAFIKSRDSKPGNVFLGLVHRLDRPTSGILVLAKTSKALGRLSESFRTRVTKKIYWALLEGVHEPELYDNLEFVHYLSRDTKRNMSVAFDEAAPGLQEARLRFSVIAKGNNYSLAAVELFTGRHHQIRCQLAARGFHIKGDLKYGAARSNPDGGISLHAVALSIPHPVKEEPLLIFAPPQDVQQDVLWGALMKWPPSPPDGGWPS